MVYDHWADYATMLAELGAHHCAGQMHFREDISHGLASTPAAFERLMRGLNQGKSLVLLRANDTFIGALGLMQRLQASPAPPPEFKRAGVGQMIMVINVADLDTRWAKIETTPHIKIDTKPERVEYPGPGGSVIPVMFSSVWDAGGNFIELNKLLGAAAGTAAPAAK